MPKPENYAEIKGRVERLCAVAGLELLSFPIKEIGLEILKIRLPAAGEGARPIYLGAGVHGDEPAAVTAVLQFLEERRWEKYPELQFMIYPCINPAGYDLDTRENADGDDINRSFHGEGTPESRTMREALKGDRYDFWIDAHEDYAEDGYYMFAPGDAGWAAQVVKAVSKVGPVTTEPEIDEMRIVDGIVQFDEDISDRFEERKDWPLAFYLMKHFTEQGCTPETPGLQPLDLRVEMQLAVYDAALSQLASGEIPSAPTPTTTAASPEPSRSPGRPRDWAWTWSCTPATRPTATS